MTARDSQHLVHWLLGVVTFLIVYGSLTNVIGLPLDTLCRRLKAFGID